MAEQLVSLPRNKLLALLGTLALLLAPHLAQMPFWLILVTLLPLAWRAYTARSGRRLPGRAVRLFLAGAMIVLVFLQFRTLVGRDGGVVLLACLVALKLLETTSRRDVRILTLLGYFVAGTLFLVSQSFWMLAYVVFVCVLLTGQLFAWQRDDNRFEPEEYRRALRLMLEGLPVALLLFVLYPRLATPLWSMPADRPQASTGIADTMTPGSFSDLTLDDSVAFRVDFRGRQPERDQLYWRGPVFERFDGYTWLQREFAPALAPKIVPLGRTLDYTITLEPQQRAWLFALDLPTRLPQGARLTSRMQAVYRQPLTTRARFDLQSATDWRIEEDGDRFAVTQALVLPHTGNPRARQLAQGWRTLPPQVRVARALMWLQNNRFFYSLAPPLLDGADQVDQFLFTTKEGFCEHYAGSFAFLMRAAGVPARVVGGYLGGEYNAAGDYWIVRQADAHAWVEVWLEGRGWQRVDPTAVVSPLRVSSGLARSVRDSDRLPMLLRENAAWLANLRLKWDNVVYVWDRWVIGYDTQRQMQLLKQLGVDSLDSATYLAWLVGGFAAVLALYTLAARRGPRADRPRDPAARQWRGFLRRLAQRDLSPHPGEGPRDFALRAAAALPAQAELIRRICNHYLTARYGDDPDAARQLAKTIKTFRL
ncbi:transglutaminase TgpA family protein [Chitiniphilus shinanonensis]|uniref:transglutaminase TgpA family protein n=1 Tax=Chitiniphilus shinanonensis TaxID=553088 RepID=UPI0030307DFC